MFSKISWGQYFIGVAILLIAYYATVFFLYRNSWNKGLSRLREKLSTKAKESAEENFETLEAMVDELRSGIMEPMGKDADKQELLTALYNRLKDYDGMQQPAYRQAINNFIIRNARQICGVDYSEEELNEAWRGIG